MFSIGKNGILSSMQILRLPQNCWPYERSCIFTLTFWCFTQADMWSEKNIKYKFTFYNEELILLRSERTLGMHLSARGWLFLQEGVNEVMLQKWLLVQLILIVVENSLVLFLSAESYIMKIHCSWFVDVYHTGIYCHKQKSWKYSQKCNTMEFNNSSWSIF